MDYKTKTIKTGINYEPTSVDVSILGNVISIDVTSLDFHDVTLMNLTALSC